MNSTKALNVGRDCDVDIAVNGHNLYVRLCEYDDVRAEDGELLVKLHEETKRYCQWAVVKGVGNRVGKPRRWSKKKLEFHGIARWTNDDIEVGDYVLCLTSYWGISSSPYAEDESFVDETAVRAIVKASDMEEDNGQVEEKVA